MYPNLHTRTHKLTFLSITGDDVGLVDFSSEDCCLFSANRVKLLRLLSSGVSMVELEVGFDEGDVDDADNALRRTNSPERRLIEYNGNNFQPWVAICSTASQIY